MVTFPGELAAIFALQYGSKEYGRVTEIDAEKLDPDCGVEVVVDTDGKAATVVWVGNGVVEAVRGRDVVVELITEELVVACGAMNTDLDQYVDDRDEYEFVAFTTHKR